MSRSVVAQQGRTLGQSQDNQVLVPISAFCTRWGRRNSVDLLIHARGGVPWVPAAIDEARSVLRALRHTPSRDPDPFGVLTAEIISGVSLGVGGVGSHPDSWLFSRVVLY